MFEQWIVWQLGAIDHPDPNYMEAVSNTYELLKQKPVSAVSLGPVEITDDGWELNFGAYSGRTIYNRQIEVYNIIHDLNRGWRKAVNAYANKFLSDIREIYEEGKE